MKALLLVAHGSRRRQSNEEIARLSGRLSLLNAGTYATISHAFLELADPGIDTAVSALAELGVTQIDVAPYFLSAGRHVSRDVPRLISQSNKAYPAIRFRILPHVGATDGMPELIMQTAAA